MYFYWVYAFLYLKRKKNSAILRGISTTVKNTINLMYPSWYYDWLLTVLGLHFGPAYIISQTVSSTTLATIRANVNLIYILSKKFIKKMERRQVNTISWINILLHSGNQTCHISLWFIWSQRPNTKWIYTLDFMISYFNYVSMDCHINITQFYIQLLHTDRLIYY